MAQRQREIIEMDQLLNDGFSSEKRFFTFYKWEHDGGRLATTAPAAPSNLRS